MANKPYYSIVPCCPNLGTELNYFNSQLREDVILDGVYVYNGKITSINGIIFQPGKCYTVTNIGTSFSNYPQAPSSSKFLSEESCDSEACDNCEEIVQCYTLYPCESNLPILVSTSDTLLPYVGDFTGLVGYMGCYFVVENDIKDCVGGLDILADPLIECSCVLNCYSITGNPTSITYVNENSELITTSGNIRICSLTLPLVEGGLEGVVYNFGPCDNGVCPEVCFKLTNCVTAETLIITNTTTVLGYYVDNAVVTVQGYSGCWTIDISDEPCDCAVNVSILQAYDNCLTCVPTIAYKFINCDNQSIVKYSTEDYSDYVNKTVTLDCGECWFVEEINYQPPTTQPIAIITSFESCLACNRTYYELVNCSSENDIIYTYTNLNTFIGNVVKLEDCPGCWTVSELPIPSIEQSNLATSVIVTFNYDDCVTCGEELSCRCSIAWPNDTGVLSYIDCTGELISTEGLDPNEQSEKVCVRYWINARNPIYFGDCINGNCPVEPLPKRVIKPGYFTPACDTEKYEKFACNSSDILYKTVLEKRYGISNCCPDTELGEKWLIKKELADLQGAIDVNYVCTSTQTCCNNTTTCNCGCNNVGNTCNS